MCRRFAVHAFPPDVAFVGERDVRKDRVRLDRLHRIRIGRVVGARSYSKEAVLRIDRTKFARFVGLDPGDIVAHGRYLPAFFQKRLRRDQHCKVRLAARRRERRTDIIFAAIRRFDTNDQHVLGKPALSTPKRRSDTQSQTLLAKQSVTAIARTVRNDRVLFGKVNNILVLRIRRTWPRNIGLTFTQRHSDRVQTACEFTFAQCI